MGFVRSEYAVAEHLAQLVAVACGGLYQPVKIAVFEIYIYHAGIGRIVVTAPFVELMFVVTLVVMALYKRQYRVSRL